jgi:hypothetical protein
MNALIYHYSQPSQQYNFGIDVSSKVKVGFVTESCNFHINNEWDGTESIGDTTSVGHINAFVE